MSADPVSQAEELFLQGYNCAQAVLFAYQEKTGRSIADIIEFKVFGGGRAPENECGALYAACQAEPASAAVLRESFARKAGTTVCRELKSVLHYPCADCVALAAELLEKHTTPRS